MLVRCLYASRAARLERPMVDAILAQARHNNLAHGITGILCHCEASFIQVLEGSRDAVGELLTAIMRDERHHGVRILVYEEIGERRFGQWAMGQVEAGRINQALLLKYSALPRLDPFAMPGCSTMSLMEELRATASIIGRGG